MTPLPTSLVTALTGALRAVGDDTTLTSVQPVGGGCISHAYRLTTARSSYFLKWNAQALPGMFSAEAQGLRLIRATRTVRVPAVIAVAEASTDCPAYILLEWLETISGTPGQIDQARLGTQLAAMHRVTMPAYGLDHDNYLGSTPQPNGWDNDWIRFFRERRLRPQIELAQRNGRLPSRRRRGLERLLEQLDRWLSGIERQPALLHGDLWAGNVLSLPDGTPALIDPAIYYGDREAELAYTRLFGGFHAHFMAAYQEAWPLAPDYADRCDLYNLYHLLNHLNLFGESYGAQVDAVVQRYVGMVA